jgi:hypothetical protein
MPSLKHYCSDEHAFSSVDPFLLDALTEATTPPPDEELEALEVEAEHFYNLTHPAMTLERFTSLYVKERLAAR